MDGIYNDFLKTPEPPDWEDLLNRLDKATMSKWGCVPMQDEDIMEVARYWDVVREWTKPEYHKLLQAALKKRHRPMSEKDRNPDNYSVPLPLPTGGDFIPPWKDELDDRIDRMLNPKRMPWYQLVNHGDGEVWRSKDGQMHVIAEMDFGYVERLITFLERNAFGYYYYDIRDAMWSIPPEGANGEEHDLSRAHFNCIVNPEKAKVEALEWMRRSKVYQSLQRRRLEGAVLA